jgi:hypothetical protein
MSKNIIFQYLTLADDVDRIRGGIHDKTRTQLLKESSEISRKSFEIYAKEIGCEYMFSDEKVFTHDEKHYTADMYECLRVIYDPYFDQFDNVLFADADIVANTKENIFDLVHDEAEIYGVLESDIKVEDKYGGYNSWDGDHETFNNYVSKFNFHNVPLVPVIPEAGIGKYESRITILNTGVLIWTKTARLRARKLFDNWKDWVFPERLGNPNYPRVHNSIENDQPFISGQLMKHGFEIGTLNQEWNDTPPHYKDPNKWIEGNGDRPCYFLHYTGGHHKYTMIEQYHKNEFPIFRKGW